MFGSIAAAAGAKLAGNKGLNVQSNTKQQLQALKSGSKHKNVFGLVAAMRAMQAEQQQQQQQQYEYDRAAYDRNKSKLINIRSQMGPPPVKGDWLGDFYKTYNIGGRGGKLDQEARDYWSNEAKTKGRRAVMDIIRGTAQAEKTWGGRSKPKNLGSLLSISAALAAMR